MPPTRNEKIEIIDYSEKKGSGYRNKNIYAPQHPSRALLCGSSGSGKTNLLLNLIYNHLEYDRIYIYAKNTEQHEYELLKERLEKISELKEEPNIFFIGSTIEDIKPLSELDHSLQNLIIFDDFVTQKDQSAITDYFIRSRHKNCSVYYLSQSYTLTPMNVRRNCTYFMFFKLPQGRDLSLIYNDHAGEISKPLFKKMFVESTKKRYDFFTIDLVNDSMKYRHGLSEILET